MTVHNYVDILEAIPPNVWKDLSTWYTTFELRSNKDICKNKKTLEYMQKIIGTLDFPLLSRGDELQFDVWKYKNIAKKTNVHSVTFTKGKHSNLACNVSYVLVDSNRSSIIHATLDRHAAWMNLSWNLWDSIRRNKIVEYKASLLTEEQLQHIAVQQTESTIVIASKVNKIEAEVQALKQKIATGTLSLEDTKNFYHKVYQNLLEVNRNSKILPK
jgi:anti-sigma28 factor (negative regulator of flagellin synthesis)